MKCELRFLVVVGKFTHCVQDGSNSFKLSNFLNYKGLVKKLYSAIALILNNIIKHEIDYSTLGLFRYGCRNN